MYLLSNTAILGIYVRFPGGNHHDIQNMWTNRWTPGQIYSVFDVVLFECLEQFDDPLVWKKDFGNFFKAQKSNFFLKSVQHVQCTSCEIWKWAILEWLGWCTYPVYGAIWRLGRWIMPVRLSWWWTPQVISLRSTVLVFAPLEVVEHLGGRWALRSTYIRIYYIYLRIYTYTHIFGSLIWWSLKIVWDLLYEWFLRLIQ